ncbi:MAG: OB-fold nucleic acid binding domain-containing protein, partial [Desulfotomaculales bacterium]
LHPMAPWRPVLARRGYVAARDLVAVPHGHRVKVAGLPVAPHRPPTRSGRVVVFLSLEDETGFADVTVFEDRYHRYGALIFTDRPVPLAVHGTVQRRGRGAGLVAEKILPFPVDTG